MWQAAAHGLDRLRRRSLRGRRWLGIRHRARQMVDFGIQHLAKFLEGLGLGDLEWRRIGVCGFVRRCGLRKQAFQGAAFGDVLQQQQAEGPRLATGRELAEREADVARAKPRRHVLHLAHGAGGCGAGKQLISERCIVQQLSQARPLVGAQQQERRGIEMPDAAVAG